MAKMARKEMAERNMTKTNICFLKVCLPLNIDYKYMGSQVAIVVENPSALTGDARGPGALGQGRPGGLSTAQK